MNLRTWTRQEVIPILDPPVAQADRSRCGHGNLELDRESGSISHQVALSGTVKILCHEDAFDSLVRAWTAEQGAMSYAKVPSVLENPVMSQKEAVRTRRQSKR
jgi:hypothetical protein